MHHYNAPCRTAVKKQKNKKWSVFMMSNSNQKEGSDAKKRVLDIALSIVLLGTVGFSCYYVASDSSKINQTNTYVQNIETTEPTEEIDENKVIYQNEEHPNSDVYNGPLMLVNNKFMFQGSEEDITSLYEVKLEADSHSFSVRDAELLVRKTVADELVKMFDDFFDVTYDDNILVLSGYRSKAQQKKLYDEDLAATGNSYSERVAKPGHSEHQTGYCVDLSLIGGEDYDGSGIYEWIDEHCFRYGFVLRYPKEKTVITEIQYEPWHYRYVGVPHAYYMKNKRYCLEEYMAMLKEYPYDGEHLQITNYDGKIYEVYYVVMDASFDTTMVPVPAGLNYEVSGNNSDGFIVTVDTGEIGELPTEAPTETTTTEATTTTETTTTTESTTSETTTSEEGTTTAKKTEAAATTTTKTADPVEETGTSAPQTETTTGAAEE